MEWREAKQQQSTKAKRQKKGEARGLQEPQLLISREIMDAYQKDECCVYVCVSETLNNLK